MRNIFKILSIYFLVNLPIFDSAGFGDYGEKNIEKIEIEEFKGGYIVNFHNTGYEKEREIAYNYYLNKRKDIKVPPKKQEFGIDLYDVDGDGKKEILVYVDSAYTCARARCDFFILKSTKRNLDNVKVLLSPSWSNSKIKILSTPDHFSRILYYASDNVTPYAAQEWNGKEFVSAKIEYKDFKGATPSFYRDRIEEKYKKAQEIAHKYFQDRYPQSQQDEVFKIAKDDIWVSLFDINNDGEEEILTIFEPSMNITAYCTPWGDCPFGIIKPNYNNKTKIAYTEFKLKGKDDTGDLLILNSKTNGIHDILFLYMGIPREIWKWNGNQYRINSDFKSD